METLIGLDTFDDLSNVARRRITNVVIHEDFTTTPVRDENDIAIATLNEPVKFSEIIVPICLPVKSKYILPTILELIITLDVTKKTPYVFCVPSIIII